MVIALLPLHVLVHFVDFIINRQIPHMVYITVGMHDIDNDIDNDVYTVHCNMDIHVHTVHCTCISSPAHCRLHKQ